MLLVKLLISCYLLRTSSLKLVQQLLYIIRQSPENVKVFISTRAFTAIEDYLTVNVSTFVDESQHTTSTLSKVLAYASMYI